MRSLRENITKQRVVGKILVSTRKYELYSYCCRVIKRFSNLVSS